MLPYRYLSQLVVVRCGVLDAWVQLARLQLLRFSHGSQREVARVVCLGKERCGTSYCEVVSTITIAKVCEERLQKRGVIPSTTLSPDNGFNGRSNTVGLLDCL